MKKILCYGDSNTWGAIPHSPERYDDDTRWTRIVQKELGDEYLILEDGINGRTTIYDMNGSNLRNGLAGLGFAVLANHPLDAMVVMLGLNDLILVNAEEAINALATFMKEVVNLNETYKDSGVILKAKKILLVAPPTLRENIDELWPLFKGKYQDSLKLIPAYKKLAEDLDIEFLDGNDYAKASDIDGLHLSKEGHLALGKAISEKLKEMFK